MSVCDHIITQEPFISQNVSFLSESFKKHNLTIFKKQINLANLTQSKHEISLTVFIYFQNLEKI